MMQPKQIKLLVAACLLALAAATCAPVDGIRKQTFKGPRPRAEKDVAAMYNSRHDIPPDQWGWKESKPYQIADTTYYPLADAEGYEETGTASWYGPDFHDKPTANGEMYNQDGLTAAHRTLPFNTLVLVENLDNGKSVVVRVNDRGPFAKNRIIDLSKRAAHEIEMVGTGTAKVRLTVKYAVKQGEVKADAGDGEKPSRANGWGFIPVPGQQPADATIEPISGSDGDAAPSAPARKPRQYSGKMRR